jgi:hypothetical protein
VVAPLAVYTLALRDVPWSATTDAPWLRVVPAEAVASPRAPDVWVVADPSGLDPGDGPFEATIVLHAPGSAQGTLTVPVTLTIIR